MVRQPVSSEKNELYAQIFILNLFTHPRFFFLASIVVIFSICFHEFCHAWIALKLGDPTAAERGHLTLNPLHQMGVFSLIVFLLLGFAWGAVPVDLERLRRRSRWAELAVSLAGPGANFLLFAVSWAAFGWTFVRFGNQNPFRILDWFFYAGVMNGVLCLFNLLPVPGLDGWNVFRVLFPRLHTPDSETMKGILVVLIFAALFGVNYLFRISEYLMRLAPSAFL